MNSEDVCLCRTQARQEACMHVTLLSAATPPLEEASKTVMKCCMLCHLSCPNTPLYLISSFVRWGGFCPHLGARG